LTGTKLGLHSLAALASTNQSITEVKLAAVSESLGAQKSFHGEAVFRPAEKRKVIRALFGRH
jgi:hypothetical protein